jgi:hypothetical protein
MLLGEMCGVESEFIKKFGSEITAIRKDRIDTAAAVFFLLGRLD